MKTPLKDIASIKTGVYATPSSDGDAIYIQTKDLDEFGNIITPLKPSLLTEVKNRHKHLLQPSDIIYVAKGFNNVALIYNDKHFPKALASTAFQIIRIEQHYLATIIPAYLAWYINQTQVRLFLQNNYRGTSPPSIPLQVIKDLEIYIPPIPTQQKILKIHNLRMHEKQLKSDIERLKEIILNYQLSKATKL